MSWLKKHQELFQCAPPEAGAIVFPRYNLDINSTELVERIRTTKSVLICPGDHFGMDSYLRFGYGEKKEILEKALDLIEEAIKEAQAI
jgi:aspartate/methionine/tyrosine aminotransferase